MQGVLEGIRVLDLSRVIAGPYGALLLAVMGAEVIRVEKPGGEMDWDIGAPVKDGPGRIAHPLYTSCNKQGITLNLRQEKGRAIFAELVKKSDVVVHNYSYQAASAMGLVYEDLEALNPGVILAAVSGFGQTGPLRERNCWDPNAQAMSGIMSVGGFPGNPPTRISLPAIDYMAACYTALGVMYALRHRDQTGQGQLVDIALFDLAVSLVGITAMEMEKAGQMRTQVGNATYWTIANTFKAKDGWVFLSLATNSIWKRFCQAMGAQDLLTDEKYQDDYGRFVHRQEIMDIIQKWASERNVKEILTITEERHVPCTPVNDLATAVSDPQVRARDMLVDVDYGPGRGVMPIPGLVIKMSKTPGKINSPCPSPGRDNQEVYARVLGYGPEELKRLEDQGVI